MLGLNLIGPGRVGRALAMLWRAQGVFEIRDLLARTPDNAAAAGREIGAGRAVASLGDMRAAEVWMLATPDARLADSAAALAAAGLLRKGDVVFHCSGALGSAVLAPAVACGALVASVHPLKSFAEPSAAAATFGGTYCACEGDAAALALLRPAFERIGARISMMEGESKTLYHAAAVLVCNDLTALMESGVRCCERAGIPRATALHMLEPLVRETLDNIFRIGTTRALTGPVVRGDADVVARHLAALDRDDPEAAAVYRALGRIAVSLARAQGGAEAAALDRIGRMLDGGG